MITDKLLNKMQKIMKEINLLDYDSNNHNHIKLEDFDSKKDMYKHLINITRCRDRYTIFLKGINIYEIDILLDMSTLDCYEKQINKDLLMMEVKVVETYNKNYENFEKIIDFRNRIDKLSKI